MATKTDKTEAITTFVTDTNNIAQKRSCLNSVDRIKLEYADIEKTNDSLNRINSEVDALCNVLFSAATDSEIIGNAGHAPLQAAELELLLWGTLGKLKLEQLQMNFVSSSLNYLIIAFRAADEFLFGRARQCGERCNGQCSVQCNNESAGGSTAMATDETVGDKSTTHTTNNADSKTAENVASLLDTTAKVVTTASVSPDAVKSVAGAVTAFAEGKNDVIVSTISNSDNSIGSLVTGMTESPAVSQEEYEIATGTIASIITAGGLNDKAELIGNSKQRNLDLPFEPSERGTIESKREVARNPKSLSDLFYSMDDIAEIGGGDVSVVRVFHQKETNEFIILFPEGGVEIKDWLTNFNALDGDCALLHAYKEAIDESIKSAGFSDPIEVSIMLGGISQGGLIAGLFASRFGGEYNIEQLISLGAPIDNFSISGRTDVLSVKYSEDSVAFLDGEVGGEESYARYNWETIYPQGSAGGGKGYAGGLETGEIQVKEGHNYNKFFDGELEFTDYYVK